MWWSCVSLTIFEPNLRGGNCRGWVSRVRYLLESIFEVRKLESFMRLKFKNLKIKKELKKKKKVSLVPPFEISISNRR